LPVSLRGLRRGGFAACCYLAVELGRSSDHQCGGRPALSSNGFAGWVSYSIVMRCGSSLIGARRRPDSKCPAVARAALAMHAVLLTLASQPDGPGAQDAKGGSGKSQRRAAGGLT
jgi:hypothetical protein